MAKSPSYIVVGKGRWGARIHGMLISEGRRAKFAERTRQEPAESSGAYISRLSELFANSTVHIAWLCVPPGPHVPCLTRAAIVAGLHVIVEKPWLCSADETSALQKFAAESHLKTAVHFEYCLLSDVERWRSDYEERTNLEFGGNFKINRDDHLGLSPVQNLGSHLLAIHAYAVPHARIATIECEYESAEERSVRLEVRKERLAAINFLGSKEPIVQRFVDRFEASVERGVAFPFDLNFALRVANDIAALSNPPAKTNRS